jgi:acyl carrier protein/NADP-dependent 3-hydroxy acid dehydrogenase YdfG
MNGRHETQRETIMSKKDSFTPTGHVHDLLRANLEAVRALQAQQEQTARIHQSFLEGQLHAQQSFHALLTGQQQLAQFQPVVSSPPTLTNGYHPVSLPAQTQAAVPVTTPAARPVAAAPVPAPAPAPAPYQAQAPVSTPVSVAAPTQAQPKAQPKVDFVAALLEVVAQTTGYPQETLELSMDMEADLGIDSIKRVEILSLLSKRIPGAPQVNPEKLSALKTLQQVLDFIQAGVGAGSAPAATAAAVATSGATAAPGLSSADVQRALLEVVAQTTGYPQETLELSMDMEADLGIDSIKRVEILSLLSKRIPGAPQVNPEKLSALKTLQQVLDFIHAGASTQGGPSAHAAPPAALAASAPSAGASSAEVVTALLEVVAQTTGYPQETLELSMDMEADLGIDSIKRVEILSLLSKRVPGAPQVNPEKLSALKTLQQVVDFIAQGGVKNTMPSPAVPTAAQPSVASVGPSTQASAAAAPDAHALSRRLVLPVRMEARKADAPKFPAHEILVHDGGHPLATALVAALVALGAKARTFKDAAEVTSAVGGLVVLPAASASWSASTENALKDNLRIARSFGPRLVDTGVAGAAFFACVSLRDGAFGHALPSAGLSPLDGGSAGLIKSAAHEWPEVRCAAFDVHHSMPVADMARELALELGALGQHKAQEIGLGPAGRMTLGLREVATPVAAPSLSATDVVVVTGGARGVTADCARALALATGARLLLLGRSPAPTGEPSWLAQATDEASVKRALLDNAKPGDKPTPKMLGEACRGILAAREIQKSLELLAASGVTAAYRAVDVRDEDALGRVLAEARASLGPIRGVVHGAGVLRDKRIVDKRDDDIDQVVDTKLAGLRALLAATRSDDLKVLALFASVSGRFGRRGQSDYALANQALVSIAQAEAFARPNCRVAALDWGPWDGGMVTPALRTEFQREGVGLIGLDAGADAMVRELGLAPSRHVEVVLGAGFGQDDVALPSGTWTLASVHHLDPATHPVLADHRLGGKAVLPFALSLEWMAEAARSVLALGGPVSLEDARVLRGVTLDASPEDVCVWVSDKDAAGRATVELRSTKDQVYVRAQVPASAAGTTAPMDDPGHLAPYGRPVAKIYGTELFHGPSLEAVESIEGVSAEGMLLHLRTQETSARLLPGPARPFLLDPFALDGVFQALILWCRASRGAPSLPSSIARITRLRPFASAEPVRVSVRVREVDGAIVRSDVELSDAQGVALRLEGYSCTVSPSLDKAFQEGSAALAATSS